MFHPKLLDHFEHPRNAGSLRDATHRGTVENPACGDVLELALRVEDSRIAAVAFKAKGCVPAMACSSALTEVIAGRSLDAARNTSRQDILSAVGEVPPQSGHALDLAIDALQATLKNQLKR
jgi:NifU-like protein involved in Fe-S cluster formation